MKKLKAIFLVFCLSGCVSLHTHRKELTQSYKAGEFDEEVRCGTKKTVLLSDLNECKMNSKILSKRIEELEANIIEGKTVIDSKDGIKRIIKKVNAKKKGGK